MPEILADSIYRKYFKLKIKDIEDQNIYSKKRNNEQIILQKKASCNNLIFMLIGVLIYNEENENLIYLVTKSTHLNILNKIKLFPSAIKLDTIKFGYYYSLSIYGC